MLPPFARSFSRTLPRPPASSIVYRNDLVAGLLSGLLWSIMILVYLSGSSLASSLMLLIFVIALDLAPVEEHPQWLIRSIRS